MKEFGFNPLGEEYEIQDKTGQLKFKVVKKGVPIPLFNAMLIELSEHNKRENESYRKAGRR